MHTLSASHPCQGYELRFQFLFREGPRLRVSLAIRTARVDLETMSLHARKQLPVRLLGHRPGTGNAAAVQMAA